MSDQPSFWESDDLDMSAIHVRDTVVAPASTRDVEEFCRRWHYSNTSGSAMWRFGLWHGETLLGVIAYNLPTRTVCESVFGAEHGADKVWHMGRLVMAEDAPHNSESRLIAGSLLEIRRTRPDVWAVITYAATDAGHIGYVYQATNAIYTGTGGDANYYVDSGGRRHATHLSGSRVLADRAADLGWTSVPGGVKHRYVYILGDKRERRERSRLLRYESLPYPKADPETPTTTTEMS